MPTLYNYNNIYHKYKELHDETGGTLKQMTFQYYDCFCGCADYEIISTTSRHRNNFTIVRCLHCSTLRINPYMSEDSVTFYYKEIYGRVKRKHISPEDLYNAQKNKKSASALFHKLSKYFKPSDKILDFGSGPGGRLDEFKQQGFINLHIFDYDEKYMAYGLNQGFKSHNKEQKYNLIIISHVVEHINDPVKTLKELASNLADGGHIYIEVPMYENTKHLLGDFHLAHKYYFTNMSLTLLANISGFKKIDEFHNAILVTTGEDSSSFPSNEAEKLWHQRKRITARRELWRKFIHCLKSCCCAMK